MLLWVWVAVVVVASIILIGAAVPLLGRLGGLRRAALALNRRLAEVTQLQAAAGELERTVAGVQERADAVQERLATLAPRNG